MSIGRMDHDMAWAPDVGLILVVGGAEGDKGVVTEGLYRGWRNPQTTGTAEAWKPMARMPIWAEQTCMTYFKGHFIIAEVLSKATTRASSSVSKLSAKRNTKMDVVVTGFGCPICKDSVNFGAWSLRETPYSDLVGTNDERKLGCLRETKPDRLAILIIQ